MQTVWILGSGFSRSLGGPLLNDLLTERGRVEIASRFPKLKELWGKAHKVYQEHLRNDEVKAGGRLWANAEEFLDLLDVAAENPDSSASAVVRQAMKLSGIELSTTDLRKMAVLSVAAECSFASKADPRLEAWEPYVKWASQLNNDDTIVTFNYDTVLERIGALDQLVQNVGEHTVVLPWGDAPYPQRPHTPILKLHGSVLWSTKGSHNVQHSEHSLGLEEANEQGFVPLLGTPGPNKKRMADQYFARLWNRAQTTIEVAETIVFLGYRFPPSDSMARRHLLQAIKSNTNAKHLKIHTVLGPNTSHPDTVRLVSMLNVMLKDAGREPASSRNATTAQSYQVVPQPLWVEDFLTVLNHNFLHY